MVFFYTVVAPSEAHLVVTPQGEFVVAASGAGDKRAYFAFPSGIPFIGRNVRKVRLEIRELIHTQETYEKQQGRFNVTSSLKYQVVDIPLAAKAFTSDAELQKQLKEVVSAAVRAVTVKYNVEEVRAQKSGIEEAIDLEISKDLAQWGLKLINFQLVDFRDTADSTILSDISKRREVAIKASTREQNAEKEKNAAMKEFAASEESGQRKIEMERTLKEQEQKANMMVSEKEKEAEEKRLEVVKVQVIKKEEIDKAQAEILAEQKKAVAIIKADEECATEKIMMEQKRLEGEGDRLKAEEQAKAEAAPIRETGQAEADVKIAIGQADAAALLALGMAEAEAKEALQDALNKFTPAAITAMTAEAIVAKDQVVGLERAKAMQEADLKMFVGGEEADNLGWNMAQMIGAAESSGTGLEKSLLNRISKPHDLGINFSSPEAIDGMIKSALDAGHFKQDTGEDQAIFEKRVMRDVKAYVAKLEAAGPSAPAMPDIQTLTNAVLAEVNRRNGRRQ